MREILLRGKYAPSGMWIIGDLRQYPSGAKAIKANDMMHIMEVAPDTIGQFTGLTDKNGKEIFEGDVVHMRTSGLSGRGEIVFKDGAFVIDDKKRKRFYYMYHDAVYRVEGNIHDNPELMEDK